MHGGKACLLLVHMIGAGLGFLPFGHEWSIG